MKLTSAILSGALLATVHPGAAYAYAADDLPIGTALPEFGSAAGDRRQVLAALQPAPEPLAGEGPAVQAQASTGASAQVDAEPLPPRRDINPYDRDIDITVPLTFNGRVLGEIEVQLTRDDRYLMNAEGFSTLITPLLTEAARAELAQTLAGRSTFEAHTLSPMGIVLDYDPAALSILVLRIDPSRRAVESLFQTGSPEPKEQPPQRFSAYLNLDASVARQESTGEVSTPNTYFTGAVRFGSLVFETDFQGEENLATREYEFERRYARLVYDQATHFRRWYLGDLTPEFRGNQGYQPMGGIGVTRQRRRFDPYRANILQSGRTLILQNDANLQVLRNGALVREFRLDAGQYDLSHLPMQTGSNDFEIVVRDDAGRVQTLRYQGYLDVIDLQPGDYEYGAYIGMTAGPTFGAPDYSEGHLAFSGYWRKAFFNRPAIGLGLQAAPDVQTVTGQTQFILPGGVRLGLDAGLSNSTEMGAGHAFGIDLERYLLLESGEDNVRMQATYISEHYATLGDPAPINFGSWSFAAQYSHAFNERLLTTFAASYNLTRGGNSGDSYRADALATYRLNEQWSFQGGVSYTKFERNDDRSGAGIRLAIIWQPRPDHRLDVDYDSALNSASASYVKTPANVVHGVGWSALATYDDGPASLVGSAYYIGNRFDAGLSHMAYGRDLESVGEEQITSLRAGTAIAYAGGRVAIGRRVSDSFAIFYPHETLDGRRVIVGQGLEGGRYSASSGWLGPALSTQLGSYANQSLAYDVVDVPPGYDIGEGIKRVHPAYRSGYAFEVGTAAFVSAMGNLVGEDGKPVALIAGRVLPADQTEAEPQPFFTNSVGRFAIQGLEPGKAYHVQVFSEPRVVFQFTVPADNDGLLNLNTVVVPLRSD